MRSYAILIDGGFAKRKLGSSKDYATAEDFSFLVKSIQNHPEIKNCLLHRVYYYDSSPLTTSHTKPLNGGKYNFGSHSIAGRSTVLFDQLRRLPHFALRLGELSLNGWAVSNKLIDNATSDSIVVTHEDLRPQITQKGVDMRIGMDIAALSLKKQAQIIVLVTGDSDFVPAMKFARREGALLYLVPLGHRIKPSMYEHSDLILDFEQPHKATNCVS